MLLSSGGVSYWHEVIASKLERVERGRGFGWRRKAEAEVKKFHFRVTIGVRISSIIKRDNK